MQETLFKAAYHLRKLRQAYFTNFAFVHINKTAGSSIEKALNIPFEHKTALEKISEMGRDRWNKKLSFTVVRNPWDKVVSHYHYRVNTNQTNLRDHPVRFQEWVIRAYGEQDPTLFDKPKMFMPQLQWICDERGVILVDELLRFENLQVDFIKLTEKLGKNASLPHVKKSGRTHYREHYCPETASIVEDWFKRDIEEFDYEF